MTGKPLILIVEDETFVAMDLAMQLEEKGFDCLDPAPSVKDALTAIERDAPDLVVLDANLKGERPVSVAEELNARRIPFVYASGYGTDFIADKLPHAPLVSKPVRIDELVAQIDALLARARIDAPD